MHGKTTITVYADDEGAVQAYFNEQHIGHHTTMAHRDFSDKALPPRLHSGIARS